MNRTMTLDELTEICGYFSTKSCVNNYYNCLHPDNEDPEYDEDLNKKIGKCLNFCCPLASSIDDEEFEGWGGDHRMWIHDEDLLKKLRGSSESPQSGEA